MERSIFTYCFDPKTLKKLKIDRPVVLGGSLTEDLKMGFFGKWTGKYLSAKIKPIFMFDSKNKYGEYHCGRELIVNNNTLKNVKPWCKRLAKMTDHIVTDLEPVNNKQIPFYKELRKHYPHRITGCFGRRINRNILKHVDDTVYMFYDYSTDLRSYREEISKMLKNILKTKKPFSIGVPIVSSFYEYEKLTNRQGKAVLKSPHKMKDYTEACLEILSKVKHNKLFKGIIWWGLMDFTMERHYLHYNPSKISFNPNLILKKHLL